MTSSARKALLRAAPDWLDALELGPGPIAPNAAEIWGPTLPTLDELRIREERVARSRRTTVRMRAVAAEPDVVGLPVAPPGRPYRAPRSALRDAGRNAGLLALSVLAAVGLVSCLI